MNAKAAEDPTVARVPPQPPSKEELEEMGQEDMVDQEEEQLRSELQTVVQKCIKSLGIQVTEEVEGDKMDDAQEITDSEEDRKAKRPRSVEPGAKSSPS